MEQDLPRRPEGHSRSTWSMRAFASTLPRDWLVHLQEEDYGIDRRVEIFENRRTSGLTFNVQLKSTGRGSGQRPAETIKRRTLNYWAQMSDPTLVVIGHDPTETLWYRWAHKLPFDDNPNTTSRQVRCEDVLDEEAAARLVEEVRAYRLARELPNQLPVDVHVTGARIYGQSASPIKAAILRKLRPLSAFVRVVHGSTPPPPYMFVSFEDDKVMVGLRAASSRQLTWDRRLISDYNGVASEIVAALALAADGVTAEALAIRLLRITANDSDMLLTCLAFGHVVAMLTRHDESELVLTLLRRTAAVEAHPSNVIAQAAFGSSNPQPGLARRASAILRDAAPTWRSPGTALYNAAQLLPEEDGEESLSLFERAAVADPTYRDRGYWWRERGTVLWNLGRVEDALESYTEAMTKGEVRAAALRADVLMRTGRYREARDAFRDAPIWESPRDAQWRLSCNAVEFIVEDLGINDQTRTVHAPFEPHEGAELEEESLAALQTDALDWRAHAALAGCRRQRGGQAIFAAVAAAVIANTIPELWVELLGQTITDESLDREDCMQIAYDGMVCAWKYFGTSFAEFVLEDERLPDELRQPILDLFEETQPEPAPLELRHHGDKQWESVFLNSDGTVTNG